MQKTWTRLLGVTLVWLWCALGSDLQAEPLRIESAVLIAGGVEREVSLPHILGPSDFDPDGSTVLYRLTFELPPEVRDLQAIYIEKLSLSGRLIRDGHPVWACGAAELPDLRCLHRPQLIQLPAGYLGPGRNVLDIEIYANRRQINGLSPVIVGPYAEVLYEHYQLMRFLKTDLVYILAIVAGVAGFMSLAVGLTIQRRKLFLIFAAASTFELIAAVLIQAVDPIFDRSLAGWLVFSTCVVTLLLQCLLFHEAFGRLRLRDPVVLFILLLMVLGLAAFAVTDTNRSIILAVCCLVLFATAITAARTVLWTYIEPSWIGVVWTAACLVVFLSAVHDFLRFAGYISFNGFFAMFYVYQLLTFIMGSILFAQMGVGLRLAQNFTLSLHKEVEDRTAELQSALTSLRSLEASALRLTRNIPIGTFILQTWGLQKARYAFFSDRLRKMIDLPQGTEPPFFDQGERLLHPDDSARARAVLRSAIDHAAPAEAEFRIRSPDGNWRWLRWIMLPQPGSASPVVWDGVVIDVTEARQAEERLRIANAGLVVSAAEQSRLAERDRLLKDMHDGFGSQLSSARLAIEHGNLTSADVARILLECSEDLRIMVDALGNETGDLADAMADFRYRTDRRLQGTGIAIDWDVEIAGETRLSPTVVLQILRVLQEATNNALRHSGARFMKVCIRAGEGRLSASMVDDGRGIDATSQGGRGLANMRKRCREIGARLDITHTGPGTTVAMTMDLIDAQ